MNEHLINTARLTDELIVHSGVDYKSFMQSIITYFEAERYFEIGTQNGVSLSMMPCDSIAVDPSFKIDRPVIGGKRVCMLFQMTSDRFFAEYSPRELLNGPIDVAFLDGMHRFEYLLRDFSNIERHCRKNSIICLHDCLPPTLEMTVREDRGSTLSAKYRGYWTGDVWKVVPILKKARPDLKIIFVDCPPTGLVICTNLDPANEGLKSDYFELVSEALSTPDDFTQLKEMYRSQDLHSSKELVGSEELTKYLWL
jgi:hypothetical protein